MASRKKIFEFFNFSLIISASSSLTTNGFSHKIFLPALIQLSIILKRELFKEQYKYFGFPYNLEFFHNH